MGAGCKMYEVKFALKTVHPGEPDKTHGPGWYFFEEFGQTEAEKLAHDVNWGVYSKKTDVVFRFTDKVTGLTKSGGDQLYNCSPPVEIGNAPGDCLVVPPPYGSKDPTIYGPDAGTTTCKKVKACWFNEA